MNINLSNYFAYQNIRLFNIKANESAKSLQKITSGKAVNNAADNPAILGIIDRYRKNLLSKQQYVNNIQDGISFIQTAEGALNDLNGYLNRLKTLSVQAANQILTDDDRKFLQQEVDQIIQEVNRYSDTVKYNETYLLKEVTAYTCELSGVSNIGITNVENVNSSLPEGNYNLTTSLELQSVDTSGITQHEANIITTSPTNPNVTNIKAYYISQGWGSTIAQSFKPVNNDVNSIEFKIQNHSGDMTVKLYDSSNNLLATKTQFVDQSSLDFVKFTFDTSVSVTPGQTYYFTIDTTDSSWEMRYQNYTTWQDIYLDGNVGRIVGGNFTPLSWPLDICDLEFKINSIVPDSINWNQTVSLNPADRIEGANFTLTKTSTPNEWTVKETTDSGTINTWTYTEGTLFNQNGISFNLASSPYYVENDVITFDIYQKASFNSGSAQRVLPNNTYTLSDASNNKISVTFGNQILKGTDTIQFIGLPFETTKIAVKDGEYLDTGLPQTLNAAELNISSINISALSGAENAIQQIDNAINIINQKLAILGGIQNRFNNTISFEKINLQNQTKVFSNFQDTDYSTETTKFYQNSFIAKNANILYDKAVDNSSIVSRLFKNMFG